MEAVVRIAAKVPVRVQGVVSDGLSASSLGVGRRCGSALLAGNGSVLFLLVSRKTGELKSDKRIMDDAFICSKARGTVGFSSGCEDVGEEGRHDSPSSKSGARRLKKFKFFAKVGEETDSTQDSAGTTDVSKVVKGKGFGAPKPVVEQKKSYSAPSSSTRRAPPQNPFLGAQVDEETKQFETGFVASLAFLFFLVILEGLALAASGFLPEDWDDFLLKVIYPIFTPTVGIFLAGAAGYGVWKVFGLGGKKGSTSK